MNEALVPKRPEYFVQVGSMFENPHGVPHDEIVRYIIENPAEVVAQVVFGRYVESSGLVFTGESIQNMIDRRYNRINSNYYINGEAADEARRFHLTYGFGHRRNRYFTGIDVARQTDYTVISTIDTSKTPARLVYYKRLNRVPWETIYQEIGHARGLWGQEMMIDSTGMGGDVIMDALESRQYCVKHNRCVQVGQHCQDNSGRPLDCSFDVIGRQVVHYLPLNCVEPFTFTSATKKQLIEHLRNVMSLGYRPDGPEWGGLRIPPIVQIEEEMAFYAWDDKGLQTDTVMSLALAVWLGLEEVIFPALIGSPWGR